MRQWTAGTIAIPPPMQPAATSPSAAAFPSQGGQRLATLEGLDSSQASPCVRVGARSPANVPSWSLAHERPQETNPSARTEAATRASAASSSPAWPDAAASAAASRGPRKTWAGSGPGSAVGSRSRTERPETRDRVHHLA